MDISTNSASVTVADPVVGPSQPVLSQVRFKDTSCTTQIFCCRVSGHAISSRIQTRLETHSHRAALDPHVGLSVCFLFDVCLSIRSTQPYPRYTRWTEPISNRCSVLSRCLTHSPLRVITWLKWPHSILRLAPRLHKSFKHHSRRVRGWLPSQNIVHALLCHSMCDIKHTTATLLRWADDL